MVEISRNGSAEPKAVKNTVADEVIKVRNLADKHRSGPEGRIADDFFEYILTRFYDRSLDAPFSKEIGDEIYRLSEEIPQKERKNMEVYPSEEGNLILLNRGWHISLEAWRENWEKLNPEVTKPNNANGFTKTELNKLTG